MEATQDSAEGSSLVSSVKGYTGRYIGISKDLSVSYQDFDVNKLFLAVPVTKHFDGIPDYDHLAMTYEYTIGEGKPFRDVLVVEAPITSSKLGIIESVGREGDNKGKFLGHVLGINFDPNNAEHDKFITVLKQIYVECVKVIYSEKVKNTSVGQKIGNGYLAKPVFSDMMDPQNAWSNMSYILSYKKNGFTYITTSPPSFWSTVAKGNGTLFVRVPRKTSDGKYSDLDEISRDILEVSSFPVIKPFYKFTGVNVNASGKCKIKHSIKSAIVGSMDSKGSAVSVSQIETARKMADANDSQGISLDEQIARMIPEARQKLESKQTKEVAPASSEPATPPEKVTKVPHQNIPPPVRDYVPPQLNAQPPRLQRERESLGRESLGRESLGRESLGRSQRIEHEYPQSRTYQARGTPQRYPQRGVDEEESDYYSSDAAGQYDTR